MDTADATWTVFRRRGGDDPEPEDPDRCCGCLADSIDYPRFSWLQTLVACGLLGLSGCVVHPIGGLRLTTTKRETSLKARSG